MIRFWLLEYRDIAGNQGALVMLALGAVLYSFFYPVPYRENVLREVPIAVVDRDFTQLSRQFVRMLDASEFVRVASKPADFDVAKREFLAGEVYGIVVIPEDFQRTIRRGEQVEVSAYYDTSTLLFFKQLKTGVSYVARTLGAGIQIRKYQAAGLGFQRAMELQDPLPFVSIPLFNPGGGYGTYAIPAVFLLIIHQTILVGVGMVGGARRELPPGAATRRVRFVETVQMVIGRTGAYLTITVFTTLYALGMLRLYYGFALRCTPWELGVFLTPFLLATILLALTLSTFFRSREVSVLVLLFTSMPFLFLAGFMWPPEAMPRWLHLLAYAIPNTTGLEGFMRLSQLEAPLDSLQFEYKTLWLLTAVYFLTACFATARVPVPTDEA